jgi:hypothetical protein
MTVTSVKLAQAPGDASFEDKDDLAIDYIVRTDDPEDGPYTIEALTGNPSPGPETLPIRGALYAWGNDSGSSKHTKKIIRRIRTKETSDGVFEYADFRVSCKYERTSDEPKNQKTPDGEQARDPDDVQPEVVPGYRVISKPVFSAELIGFYDQNKLPFVPNHTADVPPRPLGTQLILGQFYPIQNSAEEPFLPVPEIQIGVPTVNARAYYRDWNNAWDNVIGHTNNAEYRIRYIDGSGHIVYDRTFAPGTLLLYHIDPTFTQFGNEIWFWTSFEFWIDDDGWDKNFFDKGFRVVETMTATGPTWKPAAGVRGQRNPTPIKLDGTGRDLTGSSAVPGTVDEVYLRYRLITQADFSVLNVRY